MVNLGLSRTSSHDYFYLKKSISTSIEFSHFGFKIALQTISVRCLSQPRSKKKKKKLVETNS